MRITTLTLFVLSATAIIAGPNTKYTYHTVEKGETLYSISRQYGVRPADLASYNESVGDKLTIKIGQKLKVPSDGAAVSEAAPVAPVEAATPKAGPKVSAVSTSSVSENYHIVKKGETFYSIAREYNLSRTDLQSWNNLDDLNLKVGQKIMIGQGGTSTRETAQASAPAAAQSQPSVSKGDIEKAIKRDGYTWTLAKGQESNVSTATGDVTASTGAVGLAGTKTIKSWKTESTSDRLEYYKPKTAYDPSSEYESLYYQNVYSGLNKKSETGVVKLMTDNNTACIAYYNSASVGTILKLTNPDNGKNTYAIVVGKIPPAENNSYVVKLSEKVARNLSVKDYASIEVVCYTGN